MRKKLFVVAIVFVVASLLAACGAEAPTGVPTTVPTQTPWVVTSTPVVEVATAQATTPEPETPVAVPTTAPLAISNSLESPKLFDAGEDPAGELDSGLFDLGINPDQIGIVFGWNLAWNDNIIPGEGCELVVLVPGWYEDFEITDGRYEVYTLPTSDPQGWTQVLVDQRVVEQAAHYGCPSDVVPPVWEGGE